MVVVAFVAVVVSVVVAVVVVVFVVVVVLMVVVLVVVVVVVVVVAVVVVVFVVGGGAAAAAPVALAWRWRPSSSSLLSFCLCCHSVFVDEMGVEVVVLVAVVWSRRPRRGCLESSSSRLFGVVVVAVVVCGWLFLSLWR